MTMQREAMGKNDFTPLWRVHPSVYETLVSCFQRRGIQPFDFVADVRSGENQVVSLRIRYGENFEQTSLQEVTEANLVPGNDELMSFFESAAHQCHAGLVKDYRVFMKALW